MIKIALITDTNQSAIWRLATALKYDGLTYRTTAFHPKKPSVDQIQKTQELFTWADLVHIQYWKSGAKIREMFPQMWPTKRKILTHYNPYNLHEESWQDYVKLVVVNKTQYKELPNAKLIPLCTDVEFFKFNTNYTKDKTVNMTVNRIEGKKGIKEVAEACCELGYKFLLVGRVSDPKYVDVIKKLNNVEFKEGVSEEELKNNYYRSAIHVCNSVPNFESGCYDDQTELLTDDGWKLFKDLNKKEKVATLNPINNVLEFHKPYKYIEQNSHKKLYCVENRSINFAVTGNHNMWVSKRSGNKSLPYEFIRADNLPGGFKIQRNCQWLGRTTKNVNWFRFMGIYLAEGCVIKGSKNSYRISIAAVKRSQRKKIKQLLYDMNFKYEEKKDQFRIGKQNEFARYLLKFGKALKKYIPKEILEAPAQMIDEFLEWFSYGDGRKYNGARVFYTSSKRLADGLQECLIKIGNNGNISTRDRRAAKLFIVNHWITVNNLEYTVYEKIKKRESYIRKCYDLHINNYNGKVYCVEVKNHILLVRRNNKAMFCGNTLPILESMACGVPVISRKVGHAEDICTGNNMILLEKPGLADGLKESLKSTMDNLDLRMDMRNYARRTAESRGYHIWRKMHGDLYKGIK